MELLLFQDFNCQPVTTACDTPNPCLRPGFSPDLCIHHSESLGTVPLRCPAGLHHDEVKKWSTPLLTPKPADPVCLVHTYCCRLPNQPSLNTVSHHKDSPSITLPALSQLSVY